MDKDQLKFFKGEHSWSVTKDNLPSCYLTSVFLKDIGLLSQWHSLRCSRQGFWTGHVDRGAEAIFDDGGVEAESVKRRKPRSWTPARGTIEGVIDLFKRSKP